MGSLRLHSRRLGLTSIATAALYSALVLGPRVARAHHNTAHAETVGVHGSHGLSLTTTERASRVLVLAGVSRDPALLGDGFAASLELIGEWAPLGWLSVVVQAPLLTVVEPGQGGQIGLGDSRLGVLLTPGASVDVPSGMTLSLGATFPTRTVRLVGDPGSVWGADAGAALTRSHGTLFWEIYALAAVDARATGSALELGGGAQLGQRYLDGRFAIGGGLRADTRVAAWCRGSSGSVRQCNGNRAGEEGRAIGAPRLAAVAAATLSLTEVITLLANAQAPIVDSVMSASIGCEVQF